MVEQKDKTKIKIEDLLKSHTHGLTITDIMNKIGLARHTVLARLHHLTGQGKVEVRQINMAKVHIWKGKEVEGEKKEKEKETKITPIKEEHIKKSKLKKKRTEAKPKIDMAQIKKEIEDAMKGKPKHEKQIVEQRGVVKHIFERAKISKKEVREYIKTGVPGLDDLLDQGIPKGSTVIIAGGAGSGKTIMCLQTLFNHASEGEKCLYMSFEESEERLIQHMEDFGWDAKALIKKKTLKIERFNPFDITRSVDALLMKAKGELLIDIEPIIFPEDFKPDFVVVDSLTAIGSAFTGKEDSYRIYIEQLFRFFEKINANSFLITETEQIPKIFSKSGVEEFLADGVIVLYSIKRGNIRENAIEVLKLRGVHHKKKIVAMKITDNGVVVYPEQEVFGDLGE